MQLNSLIDPKKRAKVLDAIKKGDGTLLKKNRKKRLSLKPLVEQPRRETKKPKQKTTPPSNVALQPPINRSVWDQAMARMFRKRPSSNTLEMRKYIITQKILEGVSLTEDELKFVKGAK